MDSPQPPIILCLILLTIEPVHRCLLSPQGVRVAASADVGDAPEFIPCGCVEASIWSTHMPCVTDTSHTTRHITHISGKS